MCICYKSLPKTTADIKTSALIKSDTGWRLTIVFWPPWCSALLAVFGLDMYNVIILCIVYTALVLR